MELGHLLTRSGITYPEVYPKVCHDSFCQLGNCVSLNIPAELLKFGGERLKQWLKHTFSSRINEKIPKDWLQGIICPLHKKGDQLECVNYRGITPLNVTYKVFSNVLYTTLLPHVEH
jgi:hypothetical protein